MRNFVALDDYRANHKKPPEPETVLGEKGIFSLKSEGVFYAAFSSDGQPQTERRICSPLQVLGETRSVISDSWGRMLEWKDGDGKPHKWAMPVELLAGDGLEVIRTLMSGGLYIATGKSKQVVDYISTCKAISRITCTNKTGWHGGAYVTSGLVYGEDAGEYVYQGSLINTAIGQRGTLAEWKGQVSACAAGNSRAVFAIGAAFAASLVRLAGIESGGFQYTGESKDGKTTAVKMAASVFGVPDDYKRLWRTTSNALEGTALMHNDGFLILDELKMCSSKEVGDVAYNLTNGQEKARATKAGGVRELRTWKLLYFSTGEISLPDYVASGGGKTFAGQEVRHADIPSNAGTGFKVMDTIHGFKDLPAFFAHINTAINRNYGTAGDAWLQRIATDRASIEATIGDSLTTIKAELLPDNSNTQHDVVATRFALVALAGEMATQYGITGWNDGEATGAAKRCFNDWLEGFGAGNREDTKILQAVTAFIERNGAKFQDLSLMSPNAIPDLVGYSRMAASGREYLVLASQFERICDGYSRKQVVPVLVAAGILQTATSKPERIPDGVKKVYVLRLQDDSHE